MFDVEKALASAEVRQTVSAEFLERLQKLTRREREVLDNLLLGQTNREAGATLGISPRTVEVHRRRVMEKTGAANMVALARLATLAGV